MLTLYRTGRQAGALQVYRDVHALLVSELGIEPGSELRALHGRVVRADPDLGGPVLAMDSMNSSIGGRVHDLLAPWSGCGVFSGRW
jgi:DNA-binding SARP family transcriptional activator